MTDPDTPRGPTTSFTSIAPYYDELMRQVPYRMWVGYYLLLLSHQNVRPRTILDVCCGTGTMCEMLAAEGFQMAGVDLSEEMIRIAKKKAGRKRLKIHYECANAAHFEMGETYDAALSFFDSLNNILDPNDLRSAFHQIAKHVRPGGSFIFDVNTAYAFETQLFDQEDLQPRSRLKYKWVGHWDPETRIITVDMKFQRGEEEFTEVHRQRVYSDDELQEMLADAGFVSVRTYHSYTLNPPRPKSDRLHYCCIRG